MWSVTRLVEGGGVFRQTAAGSQPGAGSQPAAFFPAPGPWEKIAAQSQTNKKLQTVQVWKHPANEFRDFQISSGHQKVKLTALNLFF